MFESIIKDNLIKIFYLNLKPLIFKFDFIFLIINPQCFEIYFIFYCLKFFFVHKTFEKPLYFKNYIFNILIW